MTEQETRDLINGIISGKYHAANLPYNLFKFTSNELIQAFEGGWGENKLTSPDIYSPDLEMFNSFRTNLFYFSANKTSKQVKELQSLIYDEQGNRRTTAEFTEEALKVDATFNKRYLEAEHDMTFKLAHSGREWRDIYATKDTFPYLEWVTVMDDNTMDAALNGTIKRVDDPWWDSHPIPYHWGCRCRLRQHQKATVTETPPDVPEPAKLFRNNVFKTQKVWKNDEHTYGQDLSKEEMGGVGALMIKAIKELSYQTIDTNGKNKLRVHPSHSDDADELKNNIYVGKVVLANGHSIDLLPNYKGMGGLKSPDTAVDEVQITEIKRCNSKQMNKRVITAVEQGASVVIFDLDHSNLRAYDAANRLKGFITKGLYPEIKEFWFVVKGRLIKTTRKIEPDFRDRLVEAENATPVKILRFAVVSKLNASTT